MGVQTMSLRHWWGLKMFIIDTSLWIDFLRRGGSEEVRLFVQQALGAQSAAYNCVVAMELLAGCHHDREKALVDELLTLAKHVPIEYRHWCLAANILKSLYSKGHRIPLSDVLTAAVSIEDSIPLMCRDKHFEVIKKHGGHAFECRLFE